MPDMHFIVDKTFKDLMARGHDATCFLKFLYNKVCKVVIFFTKELFHFSMIFVYE